MARRRKRRSFGLGPKTHAKKGAQAARWARVMRKQAVMAARRGDCRVAIHALVDTAKSDGMRMAHSVSRKVAKRRPIRDLDRYLYDLTNRVLSACKIDR